MVRSFYSSTVLFVLIGFGWQCRNAYHINVVWLTCIDYGTAPLDWQTFFGKVRAYGFTLYVRRNCLVLGMHQSKISIGRV